jgi:hypothetical protein
MCFFKYIMIIQRQKMSLFSDQVMVIGSQHVFKRMASLLLVISFSFFTNTLVMFDYHHLFWELMCLVS